MGSRKPELQRTATAWDWERELWGEPKEANTAAGPRTLGRLSPCVITEHRVWVGYTEGDRDGQGWVLGEVA